MKESIALNHGGQISAEPLRRGIGARFVLRLPKAAALGLGAASAELSLTSDERAKTAEDQPPQ